MAAPGYAIIVGDRTHCTSDKTRPSWAPPRLVFSASAVYTVLLRPKGSFVRVMAAEGFSTRRAFPTANGRSSYHDNAVGKMLEGHGTRSIQWTRMPIYWHHPGSIPSSSLHIPVYHADSHKQHALTHSQTDSLALQPWTLDQVDTARKVNPPHCYYLTQH